MSGKKLPKNIDFAAGFFSTPASDEQEEAIVEKITVPVQIPTENPSTEDSQKEEPAEKPKKNLGGRPKKDGLKNEQFTLTMNPETYEKLKIIADSYTRGNFSALIDDAIKVYCREKDIDLAEIKIDDSKLDIYRKRQEKKASKKK